ncbi:MAG TPA: methylated-DNA--[protein]-cysteine S-methyltransferase [Terracidiphilus sp.]|jgi:methylated-DNA-[protein]-cysteine S-methyltransferase|nr:methylated-DNA--[protein]-cysteine S-methyltransferase [Terracidiphilus sp.]
MHLTTLSFAVDHLSTPIGDLYLAADDEGVLRATFWADREAAIRHFLAHHYSPAPVELMPESNPHGVTDRVAAYFAGDLHAIDAIPVRTAGTPFQETVWRVLRSIPCGTTISYSALARHIGQPSAVRAVGLANGANPIGVVVPCHRVIGANGALTGYGGGIDRKRWLLEHEGVRERSARLF